MERFFVRAMVIVFAIPCMVVGFVWALWKERSLRAARQGGQVEITTARRYWINGRL
jgi:hypothetical protein